MFYSGIWSSIWNGMMTLPSHDLCESTFWCVHESSLGIVNHKFNKFKGFYSIVYFISVLRMEVYETELIPEEKDDKNSEEATPKVIENM